MNVQTSYSEQQPDSLTRKKSMAMTVAVHIIIGLMIIYTNVEFAGKKTNQSTLKAFNVSGLKTAEPTERKVTISKAKSIKAVVPIPSNAPVSVIAAPEGGSNVGSDVGSDSGSGGDELIWTPPQPDFTYGGAEEAGPFISRSYYVDIPQISDATLNKRNDEPVFIKFDGLLMIETSKAFAELGSDVKAQLLAEIAVDEEGKTLGCSILKGQVSDSMNASACHFLMGNIYKPATDRSGNSITGFVKANLLWDGERFSILHGNQELFVNKKGQILLDDITDTEIKDAPINVVDSSQ